MDVAERNCVKTGDSDARDPDWSAVEDLFERLAACSTAEERRRWRQRLLPKGFAVGHVEKKRCRVGSFPPELAEPRPRPRDTS